MTFRGMPGTCTETPVHRNPRGSSEVLVNGSEPLGRKVERQPVQLLPLTGLESVAGDTYLEAAGSSHQPCPDSSQGAAHPLLH